MQVEPTIFPDNSNLFIELKNKLIEIYGEHYFKAHNLNPYGLEKYHPVKSTVARAILNGLYNNLIKNKECQPLEEIPKEIKEKYWNYSKEIFDTKEKRIELSISMYTLDLITGNIN